MAAGDYIALMWNGNYEVVTPIGRPITSFKCAPDFAKFIARTNGWKWAEPKYVWALKKNA